MNIQTIDGKIQVNNARVGDKSTVSALTAYICRPDGKIICRMNGVEGMPIKAKYVSVSEIDFTVSKYVVNSATHVVTKNPCYEYLHAFCCILVPELGQYGLFRINAEPTITAQNRVEETKSFTAQTYESILQYEYLTNFKVNQGTADSLEMYDANISPYGTPISRIKLYDPEDESLSLLNYVLYDDVYGWEIYHVDASIANKEVAFSVDRKSVYSFLREDVQKSFRCIVDFDTIKKRISVYDIETVGHNTNILLSFEKFVQQIDIKPSNADIFTVFEVEGGNGLDISRVNFGSNKIINIDYPMTFMPTSLQERYATYKTFRESKRAEYANLYKQYSENLVQRNAILDRQPSSDVANNWASTVYYSMQDLQDALANYRAVVSYIENMYKEGGSVDYTKLDISPDAADYYSYKNVIIPDIQAAIEARQQTSSDVDRVDVATQWQLYGLNDLEVKLSSYKEITAALAEQGYTRPWSSSDDSISKETWNAHYAEYTTYMGYISALQTLVADRKQKLAAIDVQIASLETQFNAIARSVNPRVYFGSKDFDTIATMYKESSYSDENYLITERDTESDKAEESELLYQAAVERLEVESRPQLSWSISSDSLYAIPDFASLRNSLQNGDYCTIAYGGRSRMITNSVIKTADGATMVVKSDDTDAHADSFYKLRVVEIDFDGLDLDKSFGVVFSDIISTTKELNDFESLLGDFVSSKTNSIKAYTLASSANTASDIAQRIVRPYVEALQLQIENITAQNIYAHDIDVAKITADQIHGGTLTLGGDNNVDGVMEVYDANGNRVGLWTKDGIVADKGEIGKWVIDGTNLSSTKMSQAFPDQAESFVKLDGDDASITVADGVSGTSPSGNIISLRGGEIRASRLSGVTFPNTVIDYGGTKVSYSGISEASLGYDGVHVDSIVAQGYSSALDTYDLKITDPQNPQLASGIAHWSLLSANRQVKDTLYVTIYHCGNLFWAHFNGKTGAWNGLQNAYIPIVAGDTNLSQSALCAPPTQLEQYICPQDPSHGRLIIRVKTNGEIGLYHVIESSDGTSWSTVANGNIETLDVFWAHV